jgi:hypothetical protein
MGMALHAPDRQKDQATSRQRQNRQVLQTTPPFRGPVYLGIDGQHLLRKLPVNPEPPEISRHKLLRIHWQIQYLSVKILS